MIFIIGYGTIQSILLIYLLISTKSKSSKGLFYLIFMLVVSTYVGILELLKIYGFRDNYTNFFFLGFSAVFLIPPLFYLFSLSNFKTKTLSISSAFHILPFILFFSIQFIEISLTIKKMTFLAFVIQLFSYSILSLKLINKEEKEDVKPTKALRFLTICMLIFAICVTLLYITTIVFDVKSINLITIVICFLIVFVTILEAQMIKGLNSSFSFTIFQNKKYQNSNLRFQDLNYLNKKLDDLLLREEIYLNSNLTANDLANKLEISRHQLTELLNQELECTFHDLINQYRIECVKKNLLNQNKKHLSISGIGSEAGFKSTATFYRVFKAQTGYTPLEYKSNHS